MTTFIFDIGNVLLDYSPVKMVERVIGKAPETKYYADILFSRHYWEKLDLDEITIEDEKEDLKKVFSYEEYQLACHILDRWLYEITQIEGIVDLLSFLKDRGYKLYYLSNICSQFIDEAHKHSHITELLSYFDGGVISGPLHIVKPDERIYQHLFNEYHIDPKETFYIDDNKDNIEKGKALGLNTYLFDGDVSKLKDYIIKNIL